MRLANRPQRIIALTGAEKLIEVEEMDGPQGEARAVSRFLAMTSSSAPATSSSAGSSSSSASGPVQLAIAQAKSKVMGPARPPPGAVTKPRRAARPCAA